MRLATEAYRLTDRFPSSERYGLTSQIRRAAVSIPANIAEGCGRGSNKALAAFLQISLGSLSELECLAELAQSLGYCSEQGAAEFRETASFAKGMLCRLIRELRKQPELPR